MSAESGDDALHSGRRIKSRVLKHSQDVVALQLVVVGKDIVLGHAGGEREPENGSRVAIRVHATAEDRQVIADAIFAGARYLIPTDTQNGRGPASRRSLF